MGKHQIPGIRHSIVYRLLAEHATSLQAYKLARIAYSKLLSYKLPPSALPAFQAASLLAHSRPYTDLETLLDVCYRCGTSNSLLRQKGDVCVTCGAEFVRSMLTYEQLPLVEFKLEGGIGEDQVMGLLGQNAWGDMNGALKDGIKPKEADADVLTLDVPAPSTQLDDPFTAQMLIPHTDIIVDKNMLSTLKLSEVLIVPSGSEHVPPRYYRVMDPDMPLYVGGDGRVYEEDEYDMEQLEKGYKPFQQPVSTAEQDSDRS